MLKVLTSSTIVVLFSCNSSNQVDTWKVYYLGGQSNMDGYGHNSKLPDSLRKKIANAMIFNGKRDNEGSLNGGIGIWSPIKPGMGTCLKQMVILIPFLRCLVRNCPSQIK